MAHIEVNGAKLWVEEAGSGPAVVLLHGGLGDARLWDDQFAAFAERFRTIRYDLRFFGRSDGPGTRYSHADDVRGVLDALGIDRAALVGLSFGGGIAVDVALAFPERVWALVSVAGGMAGAELDDLYPPEVEAEQEALLERGDVEGAMQIDLEIWAPLGTDERIRTLLRENMSANLPPAGAESYTLGAPAAGRLAEIRVPTLVVSARHDPEQLRAVGDLLGRGIASAQRTELDSDHYLTMREPATLNPLVLDFLAEAVQRTA